MKIVIILLFILNSFMLATDSYNCNKVFDARKQELLGELEKIDEQQQSLEALQAATNAMLNKKEKRLNEKEQVVDKKIEELKIKAKEVEDNLKETQKLLTTIQEGNNTKLVAAYMKMGAGKSAIIFAEMEPHEACKVIYYLDPKKVGAILAKIPPKKAAKISIMLQSGPPFLDLVNNHDIDLPDSIKNLDSGF